jgi:hypothetical protein
MYVFCNFFKLYGSNVTDKNSRIVHIILKRDFKLSIICTFKSLGGLDIKSLKFWMCGLLCPNGGVSSGIAVTVHQASEHAKDDDRARPPRDLDLDLNSQIVILTSDTKGKQFYFSSCKHFNFTLYVNFHTMVSVLLLYILYLYCILLWYCTVYSIQVIPQCCT